MRHLLGTGMAARGASLGARLDGHPASAWSGREKWVTASAEARAPSDPTSLTPEDLWLLEHAWPGGPDGSCSEAPSPLLDRYLQLLQSPLLLSPPG